ncbi:MAG: YihY/virulence factor BrkB family protein [Pseudohongiellaceae bacterium]
MILFSLELVNQQVEAKGTLSEHKGKGRMNNKSSARDTGQKANAPGEIPARGWKEILWRVKSEYGKDHIQIVSAGIAFYFFLALFPAIAALVSIYGLIVDPAQVEQQMNQLTAILPQQAHQLISDILQDISSKTGQTLGWSLIIGVALSIWSAKKGVNAVFEGVNIAYNEQDRRNFFKKNGLALLLAFYGIIIAIISMALIVGVSALSGRLGLPSLLTTLVEWLRWPVLAAIVVFSLGLIYRVAPHRNAPKCRWVSWGAIAATALWLAGSALFSFFVNNFGNYDATYGSFAAVIVLMLWFFLTAFTILLGAEINSEMEHQTARDSTVGKEKPIGQRDAYYADHVAGGR